MWNDSYKSKHLEIKSQKETGYFHGWNNVGMPEFNWNVELPLECYSNIPVAINNDYEFYRNDHFRS